ncbi:ABC transporter permease [Rhodanobacter sp. DHG33]|uniref:ABC transporter permease n=1 Tax=Rhodanobacter sp. DHG33 TaxID=2775921 RepID=UPI00177B3FE7|nr:ABC transporter permease [Rhodanobacter sp. DHG33]MBD8897563.1 ABC transporter permease [Rhodanobacter sp. DHG33]
MTIFLAEIWQAWRATVRRPGFLLLAAAVLALGVGSASAVFTLVDGVLLRPMPYPEPHRLVALGKVEQGNVVGVSPQQYQQLADLPGVNSLGIFKGETTATNVSGDGEPVQVPAQAIDHNLLPTLRVQPVLGRNFSAQEDQPNGPPVVLIYHGFWLRRFGGNPAVIGKTMQVEGIAHTIVGVLPAGFDLGQASIALPTAFRASTPEDSNDYTAVARLEPGFTREGLAAQVQTRLHAFYVAQGRHVYAGDYWLRAHFGTQDFGAEEHHGLRAISLMWLASAALLLVIALVNLTNLMMLRAIGRTHDASVRGALGASPWRVALPSMAEGVLVGLLGVLFGQALAAMGLAAIRIWMPADWMVVEWTRPGGLSLGWPAWALAIAVGLFGALVATFLGLWRGHAALSADSLREGGRSGFSRRSGLLGRLLVIAQVALASLLLCAAGVFLRTLLDNAKIDLGFDARGVLTFELAPVKATYPDAASVQVLSQRLVERLRRIPGVSQAAMGTNLPAGDFSGQWRMNMHAPGGEDFNAQLHAADPGFFGVFGIRLLQGRLFADTDVRGGEAVAIVNQKFADQHYHGRALGQIIQRGSGADMLSARIVGVVASTYQFGPEDPDAATPILYLPLAQMPDDILRAFRTYEPLRFAIKVQGDPDGYRDAVKKAVAEVAPDQPINHVYSMAWIVHDITTDTEFDLMLVGLLGGLALLLAGVGMYAVMAVAVAAREREFGVRAALGASPRRLLLLVLRGGLLQIVLGLAAGVVLGAAGSGVLRAVVVQLGRSVFDPWALLAACIVLACAGVLACLVPAMRAGRTAPMHALRGE